MSFTARQLVPAFAVLAVVMAFPHTVNADPDIDTESASAVIQELQEQGYVVNVNGVPSGNTALLTTCKVTTIHDSDDTSPSPTGTTTISVDVACPIQR
jgi:hypothetical protein